EVRQRLRCSLSRRQPMTSEYDDARSPCQDPGVGNVIQLRSYPKHSTRTATNKPATRPRRVRVFLGANGPSRAAEWTAMHGRGAASALLDEQDPAYVPWTKGACVKVVLEQIEPVSKLSVLAVAMRNESVFYASI